MKERIRALTARAEFFLVITLSFAYYIATSLSVLVLNIRQLELTTGRALRGIATEVAILLVVCWILRVRGWRLSRVTGGFTIPAFLAGIPLFMAYYFLYVAVTITVAALIPAASRLSTVRVVPTAPVLVMLAFIVINSVFEEALVTGYVVTALSEQGAALAITASTLLRFLYHLYQGPVASLSVLPLGLLFGRCSGSGGTSGRWSWRTRWRTSSRCCTPLEASLLYHPRVKLTNQALNRATLARLAGMQAQVPKQPFIGPWTRLGL